MGTLLNRRRYMGGGGAEEDIYTYLKRMGCIAYFPMAADNDITDVLYERTLDSVNASRLYWDSTKGMYKLNCVSHNAAAWFNTDGSLWDGQYGVMCNCELIDGTAKVVTVNWNDSGADRVSLLMPSGNGWSGTFVRQNGNYKKQSRYVDDEINNQDTNVVINAAYTSLGIGRNQRYAASGNVYLKHLMFFNKALTFSEYREIKQKVSQI